MKTKRCNSCDRDLPETAFSTTGNGKGGVVLRPRCKPCQAEHQRTQRFLRENPELRPAFVVVDRADEEARFVRRMMPPRYQSEIERRIAQHAARVAQEMGAA